MSTEFMVSQTTTCTIVGVDPGKTSGIAVLEFIGGNVVSHHTMHVSSVLAPFLVRVLATTFNAKAVAIEKFVVGLRSAKSGSAKYGALTRNLVAMCKDAATDAGVTTIERNAATVKPWATDERLLALGIECVGGHAKDAARHALYAAVKDYGIPDPLSRKR